MFRTWGFVFPNSSVTGATIDNLPKKIRSAISDTAGTNGLAAYVGFSNGDEKLESLFSAEHMPRLAALKKRYDPDGLFNAYHPLPTRYP
jgi:FAD/FMN-containing dehydrogenase